MVITDFRLLPWHVQDLRASGSSHDVGWFVTDISGHDVQEINTSKKKSLSSWTS